MTTMEIYLGSNGEATRELYARLDQKGALGKVAMNLFRAAKCSERAKVYRGGLRGKGSFKSMAYERKEWSMAQLCALLGEVGQSLGIRWGWKEDPAQEFHRWVLYVDLDVGQVSFHAAARGIGPDYPGDWDGKKDAQAGRVIRFVDLVL